MKRLSLIKGASYLFLAGKKSVDKYVMREWRCLNGEKEKSEKCGLAGKARVGARYIFVLFFQITISQNACRNRALSLTNFKTSSLKFEGTVRFRVPNQFLLSLKTSWTLWKKVLQKLTKFIYAQLSRKFSPWRSKKTQIGKNDLEWGEN